MLNVCSRFCRDDTGAVTVDWVVLTAAIVGLGFVVLLPIAFSTGNSATAVAGNVTGVTVGYQSSP